MIQEEILFRLVTSQFSRRGCGPTDYLYEDAPSEMVATHPDLYPGLHVHPDVPDYIFYASVRL